MSGPAVRSRAADLTSGIGADAPCTQAYAFVNAADQVVAQYASGAPIADSTGPFVVTNPLRTVRVVLTGGGSVATDYTVTGTDQGGAVQTEVIAATGAGTFEGVKLWQTITAFASNINPGGTTDLRCSAYAFEPATRAIYCGGAGNLVVRPLEGSADVTYAVTTFQRVPVRARWIRLSTTATLIVAER